MQIDKNNLNRFVIRLTGGIDRATEFLSDWNVARFGRFLIALVATVAFFLLGLWELSSVMCKEQTHHLVCRFGPITSAASTVLGVIAGVMTATSTTILMTKESHLEPVRSAGLLQAIGGLIDRFVKGTIPVIWIAFGIGAMYVGSFGSNSSATITELGRAFFGVMLGVLTTQAAGIAPKPRTSGNNSATTPTSDHPAVVGGSTI